MASVFISYSSKDRDVANATCALLEQRRHRCWIAPRDILPGTEWGEAIVEGIRASDVFVLIFSRNANASPQILREVERAVSAGKPVIPFRIEDVLPEGSLEYFMSVPHWLDALTEPLENHIIRLADVVECLEQGLPITAAGGLSTAGRRSATTRMKARFGGLFGSMVCGGITGLAVLVGLGPPNTSAGWAGAALALVVPWLPAQVGQDPPWRSIKLRLGLAIGVIAGLVLYLWATAEFVVQGAGGKSLVRGMECTEDAMLLFKDQCPDLPFEALVDAANQPQVLWTATSITRAEQIIYAGWILTVAFVSMLIGSLLLTQQPADREP